MTVPFKYDFRSLSNKFPTTYDFLKFNFPILLRKLGYFFIEKRKPKIFGFKNVMERRIRKCLTFAMRYISPKIFAEIMLKPL